MLVPLDIDGLSRRDLLALARRILGTPDNPSGLAAQRPGVANELVKALLAEVNASREGHTTATEGLAWVEVPLGAGPDSPPPTPEALTEQCRPVLQWLHQQIKELDDAGHEDAGCCLHGIVIQMELSEPQNMADTMKRIERSLQGEESQILYFTRLLVESKQDRLSMAGGTGPKTPYDWAAPTPFGPPLRHPERAGGHPGHETPAAPGRTRTGHLWHPGRCQPWMHHHEGSGFSCLTN